MNMKRTVLITATALFTFASCGDVVKSPCDCANALKEMTKDFEEAGEDEAKIKKLQEKYEKINTDCEAISEKMGEKYQEEFQKCLE